MSSNDGYNIGRESADNPLSRAMNRVALERLKNEEKSNPLCGSPVQEKPYSAQRRIIPMIPSLLGVNRSSTPIQSKALRSVLYHNQQKRSSPPPMMYNSPFEAAYMHQDNSILESPEVQNTHPSELASNTANQSQVLDIGASDPSSVEIGSVETTILLAKQLHAEKAKLIKINAQISRELSSLRQKYDVASKELQATKAENGQIRQAAASTKEDLKAREAEKTLLDRMCAEMKTESTALKDEIHRLIQELSLSKARVEQLKESLETSRTNLARLSDTYTSFGATLRELGQAHDVSQHNLRAMTRDFEDTKRLAKNGLDALQPMLNDDGTLARAAETKDVLKALQDELSSSHQVTDILRDKLLDHASQLAEARGRIKDLEAEKHDSLAKLLHAKEDEERNFNLLFGVEKTMKELSQKLTDREREAIDLVTTSVSLEVTLQAALKELDACKAACVVHATEREENISKLLALQDVINNREKEITGLRAELRALKESKEDLHVLLVEAKKDLAEKETEIRSRDPNIDFQIKIKDLADELADLKAQLKAAGETWSVEEAALRQQLQVSEISKSELRGHSERLQIELDKVQSELRTVSAKETALAVKQQCLQEELRVANNEVTLFKERVFQSAKECSDLNLEFSKLKVRLEEQHSYTQSRDQRVVFAETQLDIANRRIEELVQENGSLHLALASAKEAAACAAMSNDNETRAQVANLQKKAVQLEKVNAELNNRAATLKERYRQGNLCEAERSFVSLIIMETQALEEEALVKKDNELRSRDRSLESLNVKFADAQQTISRLLAEKNAIENSMVALKRLLPDDSGVKPEVILGASSVPFDPIENESEDDLSDRRHAQDQNDDGESKWGIKRSRSFTPPIPKEELKRTKRRPNVSNVSKASPSNNNPVGAPEVASTSNAGQKLPSETVRKSKPKGSKKRT